MKTFDTNNNGGMPTYLDDLRFMETVHKEAFEALMLPVATNNNVIIISGCSRSVTTGTVTIESGWILYNGEITKVNQHSYSEPTGSDKEYWIVTTVDVVGGNKDYFDGSNHDTWKETIASIEVSASVPPNSLIYGDTKKYWQAVTDSIVYPEWKPLPEGHNEFPSTGPESRYLKDNSGLVHVSGYFTDSDPVGENIGRLPVGCRPAENFSFVLLDNLNGTEKQYRITVQTDGYIVPDDNDLSQTVNLANFPIFKGV